MIYVPIVVLNYNGLDLLRKYLKSVLETSYPNMEVVVVDNGSRDGSLEYLKEVGVRVIALDRNYGPAYARNVALKAFNSKYIAFLDNDVMTPPGWLDPLVEVAEGDDRIAACQSLYCDWPYDPSPREIPWISTAASLVRRDRAVRIGGFDEHYFFYWEDAEFSWRLYRAGFRVVMVPESKVFHEVHGTFNKLPSPFTSYLFLRNQLLLLASYYSKRRLVTNFPLIVDLRLLQSLRGPNRRARLRAVASLAWEANYLMRKRAEIQRLSQDFSDSFLNLVGDQVFGYGEFRSPISELTRRYARKT